MIRAATTGRGGRRFAGALVALALSGPALAADELAVELLRAEQLAAEGRCVEAVPVVRGVRRQQDSARAALLEGECAIREQRYADAIGPLEDARRLDPNLSAVALNLGIAHYQNGDLAAAQRELDEAVRALPNRAEAHLYRGLVLLARADASGAAAALERARSIDPSRVDPAASYYAGRAWQEAEQREKAEAALQRAIDQAPGTPWAEEAARALESSHARYRARGAWARLTAGMEYDSNVILLGEKIPNPTKIAKKDGRGVWYGRVGAELFRNADWASGVVADYYGTAQIRSKDFNTHFPTGSLWIDRQLGESTYFRFQPDVGYAWVDDSNQDDLPDDFLLIAGVTLSLNHLFENAGSGRPFFRFEHRDYLFATGPGNKAANRDGLHYLGGWEHFYPVVPGTELRGSVGATHYDSHGGEYTYVGPMVRVGGRQELPFQSTFDLDFSYRHDYYRNRSLNVLAPPGPKREDDVFLLAAELEKRLTEHLLVSARYLYDNHDSNVAFFDYERHIAGLYLTLEFGAR